MKIQILAIQEKNSPGTQTHEIIGISFLEIDRNNQGWMPQNIT
jgi:hypothetical protein